MAHHPHGSGVHRHHVKRKHHSPHSTTRLKGVFSVEANANRFVDLVGDDEKKELRNLARRLMEPGKGIWTLDDKPEGLGAKLEDCGLPNNQVTRLTSVVSLLCESQTWSMYVSGVVLRSSVYGWLRKDARKSVLNGLEQLRINIGIRVDNHKVLMPGTHGEQTSSRLDTLPANCLRWKEIGVSFTMLTCDFDISEYTPSLLSYEANTIALARAASICQRAGLVPIVSLLISRRPSTTETGYQPHDLDQLKITEDVLAFVIKALSDHHVYLEGVLIRLNPVLPLEPEIKSVAMSTMKAIINRIPPALGGVLLSDSDNLFDSTRILNEMVVTMCLKPCPLSFAYGTVIRRGLTAVWAGKDENRDQIANILKDRLKTCNQASMGQLPKDQHSIFVTKVSET